MKQIVVTKRKAVIWVAAALGVLLVASSGLFLANRYLGLFQSHNDSVRVLPLERIRAIALSYESENDIDGALGLYEEQIKAHIDKEEQRSLLLYKSNVAVENERYDVALDAAKRAERLASNGTTDRLMARIYEARGDKQKALTYYKKVLDGMPKERNDLSGRDRPVLEQKIEELER